jgi:hypothetical protein
MTVENQTIQKRVQSDGVTALITFSFKVQLAGDFELYKITRATSVAVLLTGGGVDYTLTLADDDEEGGSITLTSVATSAFDYLLLNALDITQPADFPTEGSFNETSVENALDRACLINLVQQNALNRSLKLKVEDVLNTTNYTGLFITAEATADRMGRALAWNAAGTEIEAGPLLSTIEAAEEFADETAASAAAAAISETNAGISEDNAANSAALAAALADSILWNDVIYTTTTPLTLDQSYNGKLIVIDTSGGNKVVNLPTIAGLSLPFNVGIQKSTTDANTITVNPGGSDTVDSAASLVIDIKSGVTLTADTSPSPDDWAAFRFGYNADGSITFAKFAASAIVTAAETIAANNNDTTLPTSAAVKSYADAAVTAATGRYLRRTIYTSGSGTWTRGANTVNIRAIVRAGGGGTTGDGGNSTFDSLTANGGENASGAFPISGGTASGGDLNRTGQNGEIGNASGLGFISGAGAMGGGVGGGYQGNGNAPGGGAGPAGTSSYGGAGGGACEKFYAAPASASYSVGAGGTGTYTGGAGEIIIEEYS